MDLIETFRGWTPIRIYWQGGRCMADWCRMGKTRFADPFFTGTIDRRMREPFNSAFRHQTSFDLLGDVLKAGRPTLNPTGFMFHISRCGSTLVSQMLASLPQNLVLSEPVPVDTVVRSHRNEPGITDAETTARLRDLIDCLAEPRHGEVHLFIKFDSWTTLDMGAVLRAFPDVPWVFIYREPVEVIVSHIRNSGAQMIPGALGHGLTGVPFEQAITMPAEEYCARVVAEFCEEALRHADDSKGMFVNYDRLPGAATAEILEHFNVDFSDSDIAKMRKAAESDAKTPMMNFAPDSDSKRAAASDSILRAAEIVGPLYERLEAISVRSSEALV